MNSADDQTITGQSAVALNLTPPVNRALSLDDQGQFALLLSLMFEARASNTLFQPGSHQRSLSSPMQAAHIQQGMGLALQRRDWGDFALFSALCEECTQFKNNSPVPESYQPGSGGFRERRVLGHDMAETIDRSRRIAQP